MDKLTNSNVERQNILNNNVALKSVQDYIGLPGMFFENEYRFTKQMVSQYFDIDERTIERYLEKYSTELKHNGYIISKGKQLKTFKVMFGHIIEISNKTQQLGLFNFRAFLNLSMLIVESEKARHLRSKMLDIAIDTLNKKTGGNTKFINQRDTDYLTSAINEPKYRKQFTEALNSCLDMGNYKYSLYTDKIYEYIFKEKAKEYRHILKLEKKENIRETMYSEVLDLIASFETGLAHEIQKKCKVLNRKLTSFEVDTIFKEFAEHPAQTPYLHKTRTKMASRDLHFRDAFHHRLENYIQSVSKSDFDRFIGEYSMDINEQLEQAKDIFKRLKNSE